MKKSTTKVSNKVNGLSKAEYAQLLTKVAEYRAELGKINMYGRIFTEPRKNGLRSKYWSLKDKKSAYFMSKFVELNPTITIGKSEFKVTLKVTDLNTNPRSYSARNPSASIMVKKVK